jgi:hypothetical protein
MRNARRWSCGVPKLFPDAKLHPVASDRPSAWRDRLVTVWPQVQGAAAATAAWLIAQQIPHSRAPFFAPIAAFIALNAPLGERGLNAVRLVTGVIVGILVGEAASATLPGGYGVRVAVATLIATALAKVLFGSRRIVLAQSASAAILTVAVARGDAGITRLLDALIGAGVALVFSQLLFSPHPIRLVRRAEASLLRDIAERLERFTRALADGDEERTEKALTGLRDLRDQLNELSRVRKAGGRVARRSAVWRRQHAPVVEETENAEHLDLLGSSCVVLARTLAACGPEGRSWLGPRVDELAAVLTALGDDLGDRDARQRAADRALDVARRSTLDGAPTDPAIAPAVALLRLAAGDVMSFAGIPPHQAAEAVRDAKLRDAAAPPTLPDTRR